MSKLADYGIALLLYAAREGQREVQTARGLAELSRLPRPTVSKILKALARAGLLSSQRGTRGGYTLARPAAEISVVDVISAIDGIPALTRCNEEQQEEQCCPRQDICPTRANWHAINSRVVEALNSLKLADMAGPATDHTGSAPAAGHPVSEPLVRLGHRRPLQENLR